MSFNYVGCQSIIYELILSCVYVKLVFFCTLNPRVAKKNFFAIMNHSRIIDSGLLQTPDTIKEFLEGDNEAKENATQVAKIPEFAVDEPTTIEKEVTHHSTTKQPKFAVLMAEVAQLKSAHAIIIKNQKDLILRQEEMLFQHKEILGKHAEAIAKLAETLKKVNVLLPLILQKHAASESTESDLLPSSIF